MTARRLKRSLCRIVGRKSFLDDPAGIGAYAYDSSLQASKPDFVLFPQTAEQVARVVRLLYREGVPYVARGAGTNLSGGSVPVKKGAVIALARMKRILNIEPESFFARVEPGVTNMELQEALREYGCFFAPDPASQKVSTIGGNVAENSGGPHCLKYGVTTNHILGLKLVAPCGDVIELGGETLDAPGCELLGLFTGSEGTLGIATEIVCRILPLPRAARTMLAVYNSTEEASRTVSDIISAGITPATLEMMDNVVIRAVEESLHAGYPTDAAAVLIIEVDGIEEGLDDAVWQIEGICRRNGVRDVRTAKDEREREKLWAGRRGAFGAVARLFPNYSVSDGTVPRTKLPKVLRRVAQIGRKHDLEIGNVFHAGDGNLHPLVFFDSRDCGQLERMHRAGKEILEACVEAGGTITGEHGVGIEKIEAMTTLFGPAEIELMHRIKNALDPADLCNPGKILPEPAASPGRSAEEPAGLDFPCEKAQGSFMGAAAYLPGNAFEIAEVIRWLGHKKEPFAAVGAGTLFSGLPLRKRPAAIVRTTSMRSIVEHDAANLTVTVEPGLAVGALQEKLSRSGQFLPLDAPPNATLGGIVASALPGPRRHLYGAAKDLVLGLRLVTPDGRMIKAGGKTVKNVAGYDFGKLLVGSFGRLGVISEITFRLLPLPAARGAFAAGFERGGPAYLAAAEIISSGLSPSLVMLMNANAAAALTDLFRLAPSPHRYFLVLGAEGFGSAVGRQLEEMRDICSKGSAWLSEQAGGDKYGALVAAITMSCYPSQNPLFHVAMHLVVSCKDIPDITDAIEELGDEYAVAPHVTANIAAGSVYACFRPVQSGGGTSAPEKIVKKLASHPSRPGMVLLHYRTPPGEDMPLVIGKRGSSSWSKSIEDCFDPEGLMQW